MIRRDLPADEHAPPRWALIEQIEHARLAGKLAEHWGAGDFAPLEPRKRVVWAVTHHDDGWRAWDESPGVDATRGRVRAFTEMEIVDTVAIWTASIEGAAAAGALEGYMVAGHFCALARRGAAWRKGDPAWPWAEQFLAHYDRQMHVWLEAWQAEQPGTNTPAAAALALAQLQFFDLLSLWFCCAEAAGPDTVDTPNGPPLTLKPEGGGRFRLEPWPFLLARMNLEVAARVVPAARYESRESLAAAASQPLRLHFELRPGYEH